MTLKDLIRRFRVLAKDQYEPYFWQDEEITDWLNDAQEQACVRGRLLLEDADPALCVIDLVPGQHTYPLDKRVYELVDVRLKTGSNTVVEPKIVSRGWLDTNVRDWREPDTWRNHCARYLIQNETSVRIVPTPQEAGTLSIEAYRLPMASMQDDADEPEIHQASHEHLIQWALHRAYSVSDAEVFDAQRSALAEMNFTAYFGLLPDSDMRRITREDTPQVNQVHRI